MAVVNALEDFYKPDYKTKISLAFKLNVVSQFMRRVSSII